MTYWRLYYHVVWSTHRRQPWLDDARADLVQRAIRQRLHEMGVLLHGIHVMPDHVHVAMSVSPDDRVAWVVQQIKGSSSFLLQREDPSAEAEGFAWQREYAVLSFSERNLPTVLTYIANQRTHHENGTVSRGLEPCRDDPQGGRRSAAPNVTAHEESRDKQSQALAPADPTPRQVLTSGASAAPG